MAPAVKPKSKMEQLQQHLAQLEARLEVVFVTPLFHRKDVERLLGIHASTLTRRMKRRDFPKPIYDAGRPKWRPSDFAGQLSPG